LFVPPTDVEVTAETVRSYAVAELFIERATALAAVNRLRMSVVLFPGRRSPGKRGLTARLHQSPRHPLVPFPRKDLLSIMTSAQRRSYPKLIGVRGQLGAAIDLRKPAGAAQHRVLYQLALCG
jgi:hypothetical protein